MSYYITDYSYAKARKMGYQLYPSSLKNKKIDVYKNGIYINSIGNIKYPDYPTYAMYEDMGLVPKGYSKERRRLFRIRNRSWMKEPKDSAAYLSYYILW